MRKIQKWKENYDNWDNATALSLGMDVAENQASKNYLLNLDEEGNVKQYAVSGGGGSIKGPSEKELRRIEEEREEKRENEIRQERENREHIRKIAEQRRLFEEESYRIRNRELILHEQIMSSAEMQGVYTSFRSGTVTGSKET